MMSRLALLFRTDVHVSDKSPASWKGDYPTEIWNNLEQIGTLAKEHEVTAVLDGGDYFHVKAAIKNSHALVERTARIHAAYPCPVWSIEGNHDVSYNNLDSINRQPLGVLYATGVFQRLRDQVFEADGIRVRVVGFPFSLTRTLDELRAITKTPEDMYLIAVVHQLAAESPPASVEDFFNEPVFKYADLVVPGGPDCWLFGHWHKDQGITEVNGVQFVNQGAVSRGALVRENLSRTPKVALIEATSDGIIALPMPLRVAPSSEVFDLERKERADSERVEIDLFVQHLLTNTTFDPNTTIEANVASLNFAADVRNLALEYLDRARD